MNKQEILQVFQELYELLKKMSQTRAHYVFNSRGHITKEAREHHSAQYADFRSFYYKRIVELSDLLIDLSKDHIRQLRIAALNKRLSDVDEEIIVPISIAILVKGKRSPKWFEEEGPTVQGGNWLNEDEPWLDKGQWPQNPGHWYLGLGRQHIFTGHSQEEFEAFIFGVAYSIASLSEKTLSKSRFPDDMFVS